MDLINARENFKDLPNSKSALRVVVESLGESLRVDEVSSTLIYLGEGLYGAANNEAKWKIKKIDLSSGVSIKNASADYDQIWDNRAGLTYV